MDQKELDLFARVFEKFLYEPALRRNNVRADGLKIVWTGEVHKEPEEQK